MPSEKNVVHEGGP